MFGVGEDHERMLIFNEDSGIIEFWVRIMYMLAWQFDHEFNYGRRCW